MPVQDIVNSFDDLAKQTITFVGDQTSFSDMYLRFVKSEFADVDVVIEPNLEAAKKSIICQTGHANLLIVSARVADIEAATLTQMCERSNQLHPVLAFQNMYEVSDFLATLTDNAFMARLSFLPLRARIDSSISILRLLISGERHICGEVMDLLMKEKRFAPQKSTPMFRPKIMHSWQHSLRERPKCCACCQKGNRTRLSPTA